MPGRAEGGATSRNFRGGFLAGADANPNPLPMLERRARCSAGKPSPDTIDAGVVNTNLSAASKNPGAITGLNSPDTCDQNTERIAGNAALARHSNNFG